MPVTAELQAEIDRLNREWPLGTWVRYWPGSRQDPPRVGKIRSAWWAVGAGDLIVKITGYPGGIWQKHVERLTPEELARVDVETFG